MKEEPSKSKFPFIFGVSVLLVITLVIGIWLGKTYFVIKESTQNQIVSIVPTPITSEIKTASNSGTPQAKEKIPVIIYTEEIGATSTDSRSWKTVKIMRKKSDKEPEELAVVGKINEYPSKYVLSPDKKALLINLETKLQLLNFQTKKLEDLITLKKKNYNGVIFSREGKRLLIWDQSYGSSDKEYIVHNFLIDSKEDKIIKRGILEKDAFYFYPLNWRDDQKVLLASPRGEFSELWYFDLNKNSYIRSTNNLFVGFISQSGKLMAEPKFSVGDACNAMAGSTIGSYEIVDPITGKIIDKIGEDKKEIHIVEFSPTDKEVLYFEQDPILKIQPKGDDPFANCEEERNNKDKTRIYYKKNLVSKNIEQVQDVVKILSGWDEFNIGAETKYVGSKNKIVYLGKDYIISDKNLELIAQYFE